MRLSDPIIGALIGASVTFTTAMIQLTINARRQAVERAAGKPASRKRGNWLAIFALILAAGVAGFAYSEYRVFRDRGDNDALRNELQARLKDIGAVAVRLERVGMATAQPLESDPYLAAERKRGAHGVAAVIGVPACRGAQVGFSAAATACKESEALRTAVCAVIPVAAAVTGVELFSRAEDSQQPWNEARVQPGQDAGDARFVDGYFERGREGDSKEVCMTFASWSAQGGRSARILVKYNL